MAQAPAPGQAPAPPGHVSPAVQPGKGDVPDDELIEFLGEDDYGDAAWWEFLKKTAPGNQNPGPPPQTPKQ